MKSRLMLSLWGLWDKLYFSFNRMEYVSKQDNILRVVRKVHKGKRLITRSGKWIDPGDEVLKIHLYNYRLAKDMLHYSSEMVYVFQLRHDLHSSLRGLCQYIKQLPNGDQIKAVVATSMLNRPAERFGFDVYDVPCTMKFRLKNTLYRLIYVLMHPEGARYVRLHGHRLASKQMVIAVEDLFKLYANHRDTRKAGEEYEEHAYLYGR